MSKLCQLFSGSTGNSTYIGCGDGGILIDIGVSAKRMGEALCAIDADPKKIRGIFITHEHTDHIKGLRVFACRYNIPVFGQEATMVALENAGHITPNMQAYILDVPKLEVGGFEVSSFVTSHDSAASCGYRVSLPDNRQVAVCTDLGFVSTGVRQGITGCDAIVLESNHDVDMLKTGPYPYYLKERVLSRRGHLANETCAAELPRLIAQGTTRLVLAHLSQENNMPILARRTAVGALKDYGMQENKDYTLNVASPCGGQPILL